MGRSTTGSSTRPARSLGEPFHYRDARGPAGGRRASTRSSRRSGSTQRTGVQFLPFNTLYQLAAERGTAGLRARRDRLLLIPDLIGHWLTGVVAAEATNASTTGLFDVAHARRGRPT